MPGEQARGRPAGGPVRGCARRKPASGRPDGGTCRVSRREDGRRAGPFRDLRAGNPRQRVSGMRRARAEPPRRRASGRPPLRLGRRRRPRRSSGGAPASGGRRGPAPRAVRAPARRRPARRGSCRQGGRAGARRRASGSSPSSRIPASTVTSAVRSRVPPADPTASARPSSSKASVGAIIDSMRAPATRSPITRSLSPSMELRWRSKPRQPVAGAEAEARREHARAARRASTATTFVVCVSGPGAASSAATSASVRSGSVRPWRRGRRPSSSGTPERPPRVSTCIPCQRSTTGSLHDAS